jgi:hypothetical protein
MNHNFGVSGREHGDPQRLQTHEQESNQKLFIAVVIYRHKGTAFTGTTENKAGMSSPYQIFFKVTLHK